MGTVDRARVNTSLPPTEVWWGWVFATALLLHGPVDLVLTSSAMHLESNPIVLAIGWEIWLLVKVLMVPVAALVWYDYATEDRKNTPLRRAGTMGIRVAIVVMVVLGVTLILPNIIIIALSL